VSVRRRYEKEATGSATGYYGSDRYLTHASGQRRVRAKLGDQAAARLVVAGRVPPAAAATEADAFDVVERLFGPNTPPPPAIVRRKPLSDFGAVQTTTGRA
jgi:hypothetical protein